jgi:hypothetical protein
MNDTETICHAGQTHKRFPKLNDLERSLKKMDFGFLQSGESPRLRMGLHAYDEIRKKISACAKINFDATEHICRNFIPHAWLGLYETAYTGPLIDKTEPAILDVLHKHHPPAVVAVTETIVIGKTNADGSIDSKQYKNGNEFPNHNERQWIVYSAVSASLSKFDEARASDERHGLTIVHLDGAIRSTWEHPAIFSRLEVQLAQQQLINRERPAPAITL